MTIVVSVRIRNYFYKCTRLFMFEARCVLSLVHLQDLAVLVDKFFHGAPALHDLDYTGFMSQLTEYSQQVIRSN